MAKSIPGFGNLGMGMKNKIPNFWDLQWEGNQCSQPNMGQNGQKSTGKTMGRRVPTGACPVGS